MSIRKKQRNAWNNEVVLYRNISSTGSATTIEIIGMINMKLRDPSVWSRSAFVPQQALQALPYLTGRPWLACS